MRLRSVALWLVVCCLGLPAIAQDVPDQASADKDAAIRKLIKVSGQSQAMKQVMLSMIDQMRPVLKDLPDEFFEEFKKAALSEELPELLVAVYDRHFSHEEILQLIDFYQSPIGRAMVERQPLIQQDSMGAGQAWGARKAQEIMARLKERGLIQGSPAEGGSSQ